MLRKEKNGISWLEYESFLQFPKLKHGIFLRHGGKSTGNHASLNLSYNVEDDKDNVAANEKKVLSILNLQKILRGNLCHGNQIYAVNDAHHQIDAPCDGLSTQIKNTGLLVTHADCQAAIFYDPITHSLAVVHSGWRGNVQNIYEETIKAMRMRYGALPENIHVGISPSLGPHNAEFIHYKTELPEVFWDFQVKPAYFDFWEISRMQLQQAGVLGSHIEIANICTYANPQDYFSYRREKLSGRHATIAEIL